MARGALLPMRVAWRGAAMTRQEACVICYNEDTQRRSMRAREAAIIRRGVYASAAACQYDVRPREESSPAALICRAVAAPRFRRHTRALPWRERERRRVAQRISATAMRQRRRSPQVARNIRRDIRPHSATARRARCFAADYSTPCRRATSRCATVHVEGNDDEKQHGYVARRAASSRSPAARGRRCV